METIEKQIKNCEERIRFFTNAINRKQRAIEKAEKFYYSSLDQLKADKQEYQNKLQSFKDRLKVLKSEQS